MRVPPAANRLPGFGAGRENLADLAMDREVIITPPCIFHQGFPNPHTDRIQREQGSVRTIFIWSTARQTCCRVILSARTAARSCE
jgi:hypothetical protein